MKRKPKEDGLQLIAAYERAIIAFGEERLAFAGTSGDEAERERAAVKTLAATIGERLRAEYLSRRQS
jgi:hypothetical protein